MKQFEENETKNELFNWTNWAHYNPTFKVLIQQTKKSNSLVMLVCWYFYVLKSPNLSASPLPHSQVLPSKSTFLYCFSSANFLINNSVFNLLRKTKINLSDISLSLSLSKNNLRNLVKLLPPSLLQSLQYWLLSHGLTWDLCFFWAKIFFLKKEKNW